MKVVYVSLLLMVLISSASVAQQSSTTTSTGSEPEPDVSIIPSREFWEGNETPPGLSWEDPNTVDCKNREWCRVLLTEERMKWNVTKEEGETT